MKYLKIIILILTLYSCKQLNKEEIDCKTFEKNLSYLEEYNLNDVSKTYLTTEIEKSISFLELKSGIKCEHQGDLIGKTWITDNDLNQWRKWFEKNCKVKGSN